MNMVKIDTSFNFGAKAKAKRTGKPKGGRLPKKAGKRKGDAWRSYTGGK
jgi:hypothetical protein